MARTLDYTIAYYDGSQTVDLCKILFGGDGSYYITAPYHPLNRAVAGRVTVNYASGPGFLRLQDAAELGTVDDDNKRLKVAHHPDGFLQFSGVGITSGRDKDGNPKGIGIYTWPLDRPTFGPSFGLAFSDPIACGRKSRNGTRTVILPESEIAHMRKGLTGLMIQGFYLPPNWREFVYFSSHGGAWIDIVHPNTQAVKHLRVIMASIECDFPGLVGLAAMPHGLDPIDDQPSFLLSTSTGDLRRNDDGDLLGDQLFCLYPVPSEDSDLKFRPLAYPLPSPPYTAPPGTTELFPPGDPHA